MWCRRVYVTMFAIVCLLVGHGEQWTPSGVFGCYLLFVSDVPPFPSLAFCGRQNFVGAAVRQDLVENRYLQTSKLKARFPSPFFVDFAVVVCI